MYQFRRAAPPSRWIEFEVQWRLKGAAIGSAKRVLHDWQRDNRSASSWFHSHVRVGGTPNLCAYCDGRLLAESPETIDHFIPEAKCMKLGLYELCMAWDNLFPACTGCNSKFKRDRFSIWLLRPDEERVEDAFEIDPETGNLEPNPDMDRITRCRARKTIHILGLNKGARPEARLCLLKTLRALRAFGDMEGMLDILDTGPYRHVARAFFKAIG